MKPKSILISKHDLTRCHSCGRHHQIERGLTSAEQAQLTCSFCHNDLFISRTSTSVEPHKSSPFKSRSSRLAATLLGASALLSACDSEDPVESSAGEMSAGEVAGEAAFPLYGSFPSGEEAGETAGEIAGEVAGATPAPPYGSFPSGEEAGETAGETAGEVAGATPAPPYGSFPSGEEAGETAGETAGEAPAPMPAYGAFPAGEEG